jgi:2-keto-myo-inositol isomerase
MRDPHRVLVDENDRIDNLGQLRALVAEGYDGPASFEPFSPSVHALADLKAALASSMGYLRAHL